MRLAGRIVLPGALAAVVICSASVLEKESSWDIGPRTLPPSADVSEGFHESLANTPTPDIAPALTVPKTDADWIALAKEKIGRAHV